MTQEDDDIIQAASAIAGVLAGTDDLSDLPNTAGSYKDAAKAAIAAYLGSLEAMGWAVVRKEPDDAMIRAAGESKAKDDEGEFVSLNDHIDYSGENKTRTVIREALRRAIAASPKPPGLGD